MNVVYNTFIIDNVIEKNSIKLIKSKKTDVMPFTNSKPYRISITSNDYSSRTDGTESDFFPTKSPSSTYGTNTITTTSVNPSSIPSISGTAIQTAEKNKRYSAFSDIDPGTYPNRQSFVSSSTKPVTQLQPLSKIVLLNSQEKIHSKSNSPTMGRTFSSLPNLLQHLHESDQTRNISSNFASTNANSCNSSNVTSTIANSVLGHSSESQ